MAWEFLYIVGASQGIFLAGLLYATRNKRWAGNIYLCALSFIAATLLALFYARMLLGNSIPSFIFWPLTATPALMGPCLLFYVNSIIKGTRRLIINDSVHLLLFVIVLLTFLPETLTNPSQGLIHLDDPHTMSKTMVMAYLKSMQLLGYLGYIFWLLSRPEAKQSFDSLARKFLTVIIGLFILNSLIGVILSSIYWFTSISFLNADHIELAFLGSLTYLLAFYVFYYNVQPLQENSRYLSSALTDSVRKTLAENLREYMTTEQPFLDDQFNAEKAAFYLGISVHQLSETLTLELNTNFYNFTNQHRLKRFDKLVHSIEFAKKPLIDIAYASGFNSKTTFHRIVKAETGLTPSAYKKRLLSK